MGLLLLALRVGVTQPGLVVLFVFSRSSLIRSCRFGGSLEAGEFRSFLSCHLEPEPGKFYVICVLLPNNLEIKVVTAKEGTMFYLIPSKPTSVLNGIWGLPSCEEPAHS